MQADNPRRWLTLPVIMSAFFMYGFDAQVVNVALPSLRHDLHAGEAALELIVGGYVFVYATGLVTGGRLGDLIGYRKMFLGGMTAFTLASALCAVSQTPSQLVVSRLLQGFAAAAMVPQMLALVTVIFPPAERPRALSWYGVTAGLAGIFGQICGGLLLVADVAGLGWRNIFLVNVPVGAILVTLGRQLLPRTATDKRPRLDLVGVAGVSGSLGLALVPLIFGRSLGWPAWIWIFLVAAVPTLVLTVRWEHRISRTGGQPLLDVTLFRSRVFNIGMAMNAAFMLFFMSISFVLSLFVQDGLGLSPLRAGLCFVPLAVGAMVTSLVGRRLIASYGLWIMTLGAAVTTVSVLVVAAGLHVVGDGNAVPVLLVALTLMGLGNGLILPSLVGVPLSTVEPAQAGVASGMLSTFQQFASVTGLACVGTLFFATLGGGTDRGAYAHAAEVSAWAAFGITFLMTLLIHVITRAVARATAQRPEPAPDKDAAVEA
ncbi:MULTISPECIES: MFS transporter [Streptomyces]|uniref:MFS transporter n=1 Tax=Streptomyces tricolor TaxID=68277 RepID=A0ABS9JJH2_9ACTN|nr:MULTISPECIES: MFS transporter [Streptomyces]MCG0065715.1 MFS transporter [Streptomyces tricolor]BCM71773.1 putative transmembrane efflux protein [Streptomyces sp. EAS-AB2608]